MKHTIIMIAYLLVGGIFALSANAQLTLNPNSSAVFVPPPENNCSTECLAKNGECFWPRNGQGWPTMEDGYKPIGQCWDGTIGKEWCYCGRCYACEQPTNTECPGTCAFRSPGPNYRLTDAPCNRDGRCKCWVEEVSDPCENPLEKTCYWLYDGRCNDEPLVDEGYTEDTGYICNRDTQNRECKCWKKPCRTDRICSMRGGVCNETQPSDDYVKSDYMCNEETGCICWIRRPKCKTWYNPTCWIKFGGRCFDAPPPGLVPTGFYCDKDVPCECYTRNCTQDETCADKYNGGVCSIPSPGRDYKPTDYYCRDTQVAEVGETPEDRDLCESESSGPGNEKEASSRHCVTQARCRCWEKVSTDCSKLKCPKINGKKVKGVCSVEQPVTAVATDVYEDTGVQCRKESPCTCWTKKSTPAPCEAGSSSRKCPGGKCWPFGVSPASDWAMNGYCEEKNKCTCWKKCKTDSKCKKKGGECMPKNNFSDDQIMGKCKNNCYCIRQISTPPNNATIGPPPECKDLKCKGGKCSEESPGCTFAPNGSCDKENDTECTCWKKCQTDKSCKKKKGECIPRSESLNEDEIVGKCKNNCVCYKGRLPC